MICDDYNIIKEGIALYIITKENEHELIYVKKIIDSNNIKIIHYKTGENRIINLLNSNLNRDTETIDMDSYFFIVGSYEFKVPLVSH